MAFSLVATNRAGSHPTCSVPSPGHYGVCFAEALTYTDSRGGVRTDVGLAKPLPIRRPLLFADQQRESSAVGSVSGQASTMSSLEQRATQSSLVGCRST